MNKGSMLVRDIMIDLLLISVIIFTFFIIGREEKKRRIEDMGILCLMAEVHDVELSPRLKETCEEVILR